MNNKRSYSASIMSTNDTMFDLSGSVFAVVSLFMGKLYVHIRVFSNNKYPTKKWHLYVTNSVGSTHEISQPERNKHYIRSDYQENDIWCQNSNRKQGNVHQFRSSEQPNFKVM